jgi:hypothetical protein
MAIRDFFLRISVEDLTPFISDELRQATMPVVFRTSRGRAIAMTLA